MKVLFDHHSPFMLAHGGIQIQIEQTQAALRAAGVQAEPLRWWTEDQSADVIHFFGAAPTSYQRMAAQKGIPVVQTVVFSETCNRPPGRLRLQALAVRSLMALPVGRSVISQLYWSSFRNAHLTIVGLEAEARVLQQIYAVPSERIRRVPLGCDDVFLAAAPSRKDGDHLLCVGTITPQKRSVELAEMAIAAQTPLLFIGRPYNDTSPYWARFKSLVDGRLIRHEPHVADRARLVELMRGARGCALYSTYENWSLAADEAAACGLPLLLPDLPWSRERFGSQAHYFAPQPGDENIRRLRAFFDQCPTLPAPPRPQSWSAVAATLKDIYAELIRRRPQ
jgi:glycosyltransferase involved in cell wall biosynthesis